MPIIGISSSGGMRPTTPTIGTATDGGTGTTASVAFTPSTYIGKGTITYTATSSPGGLTATGSSSPITVTGLTTGTAYTFTVTGTTNYGVSSAASAASNSVTPSVPGAYDSIATANFDGSSNTVTFSSIPNTYAQLEIRGSIKTTSSASESTALMGIRVNGVSSEVYYFNQILGIGNSVNSTNNYGQSTQSTAFVAANNTLDPLVYSAFALTIADYSFMNKYVTLRYIHGLSDGSTGKMYIHNTQVLTAGVDSLTFTLLDGGNFTSQSSLALYGIRGS